MSDVSLPTDTRRYFRIPSIVPIGFQLLSASGAPLDPEIRTGFTRDLSKGGLCLEVLSLPPALVARITDESASVNALLDIDLPHRVLRVSGRVAWHRQGAQGGKQQLLLGIQFRDVSTVDANAIEAFSRRAALRPKIVKGVLATLCALLLLGGGFYLWRVNAYESELADSHRDLVNAEGRVVNASDRLGDMQVELRWLAVRSHELVQTLDRAQGGKANPPARPVLDELADNLDRLSVLIGSECKPKSQP
jgi:hypothetical protein